MKYISKNKLNGWEYIAFYLEGSVNRLRIIYFCNQDDEDGEDDQHDENSEDDDDDEDSQDDYNDVPFNSPIFSQRMKKHTHNERNNLLAVLPPTENYMGVPLVHCLTKTNIVKHVMFLLFLLFFVYVTLK